MTKYFIIGALAILGAIFEALQDTLADDPHFNASIFYKFNKNFWNRYYSWQYSKVLGMPIDAWHIAKVLEQACIYAIIAIYAGYVALALYALRSIVFNLCYGVIFRKQNKKLL